jgi:hypothetical protein
MSEIRKRDYATVRLDEGSTNRVRLNVQPIPGINIWDNDVVMCWSFEANSQDSLSDARLMLIRLFEDLIAELKNE